jgi:hypothetical protein
MSSALPPRPTREKGDYNLMLKDICAGAEIKNKVPRNVSKKLNLNRNV